MLEVGPGLGILTRYLADRVAHVHAVEVDRRLEAQLAGIPRVDLHWGDVLHLDIASLEPPPHKLVANLPYNIATPVVAESLALDQLDSWCVMVQREVADRFFAVPGTKAYGAVSVLIQLAAERTGLHPVSREVFRPRPNVESALVAFRRTAPAADARRQARRRGRVRATGERRSRTRSRSPASRRARAAVAALDVVGREPNVRAEALEPAEFVALDRGARAVIGPAPAKLNLALVVGPQRADGKHELVTVFQRIDLADRITVEPASSTIDRGFPADTLVRRALAALARTARLAVRIEKHVPVAAGLGGGSSDAATALRLATRSSTTRSSRAELHEVAATLGADVPFFLYAGPQLGHRRRFDARAGRAAAGLRGRARAAE